MDGINGAITTILELAGTFLDTILKNPVLAIFFAIGLVGSVIGVVRKLKRV